MAIMVPSAVATIVATTPIMMLLPNASQTPCCTAHTFSQLSKVKPRQTMFDFSESLNEKTNV